MAIQDELGRMVGPLPLGAWLAIVGVAGGYGYWRSQQEGGTETNEPIIDTSGDPAVGTGGVGEGTWIDLDPPETTNPAIPVDNDAWAKIAMNWFQANNYDMARAGQALANYLSGTLPTNDVTGWALVRTVMMYIGSPPTLVEQNQSVPTQPGVPKPAPKPVPKPVVKAPVPVKPKPAPNKKRYYTVKKGDNLTKIASKYKINWRSIFNANRSIIKDPNKIKVGWKLLIPYS